ncbi:copper resistance D family protein [Duganella aceris]|uniref:Copper resistance protein D domain-containing protein n=1 Tax=Duganella aceris TaxID=2703883 RepID=A0ABX0FHC0_9BURK|nr:hypothetical protein [Duganella aceris]
MALLQFASGLLLYLGYAWLIGSLCSRWCLGAGSAPTTLASHAMLRRGEPWAAIACMLAGATSLYAAAATMSGLPLSAAHQAFWMTVTRTAMGRNCVAGVLIMVVVIALVKGEPRRWRALALGFSLAAFACCRAMNSHAAEDGVFSLGFAVECLHLILTSLWLGIVVMSAWIVVPRHRDAGALPAPERELYLERLSASATVALVGILLSGLYNVAMRLGSWSNVGGNTYSTLLLIKVGLVLLAMAIGAYNRLIGFPDIASRGKVKPVVLLLLRFESLLLVGALVAAISLASMPPPSSL